ncbi:unnamed protein product [Paramecium sonneborni]|uniref:Uncharacterized protein n=1 Tax=Paramecium sonneborni TaxID=65129 RepID=A0A8S1QE50_9CILI|nr:unnamed protein product [Paramecium sonneborni]CAD8113733.1 unnamed protein product [Paramecium sonneborni]
MNFYTLEFEDQVFEDLREEEQIQVNEEQIYDYYQNSYFELDQNQTFLGYLQEEPILIFDCIEEVPKNKPNSIVKKSKKIKKSDTETDVQKRKSNKLKISNNVTAQLQQCQMLKTIISQMEDMLQQTKRYILNQFQQKQKQECFKI